MPKIAEYMVCPRCEKIYRNWSVNDDGVVYECECGYTVFYPIDKKESEESNINGS